MAKKIRRYVPDMRPECEEIMRRVRLQIAIQPDTYCWNWTGYRGRLGYGNVTYRGEKWTATRLVYAALHGEFDPDLDVCHSCDNPPCVNPDHLRVDTHKNNLMDASKRKRLQGQWKTHCLRGHPLEGDNLYRDNGTGFRHCKTCDIAQSRMERGWPEDIAFNAGKIPGGYMMDRETWQIVPVKGKQRKEVANV